MANYLFNDLTAASYRNINEQMNNPSGFSPHSQVIAPLSTLTEEVACRRYQMEPAHAPTTWYVRFNLDSDTHGKALADLVVPAGEKACFFKHLPGYNKLECVAFLAGCSSHPMVTDIDIVKYSDPDTPIEPVAAGLDLTVCQDDGVATAGGAGLYIKRDDSLLLRICVTPPFTDEDGNGVFVKKPGTVCEEAACINLEVHAHLRSMCFSDKIRGCRLQGDCGCETTPAPPTCEDDAENRQAQNRQAIADDKAKAEAAAEAAAKTEAE